MSESTETSTPPYRHFQIVLKLIGNVFLCHPVVPENWFVTAVSYKSPQMRHPST